jgi:hypothetical protein
MVDPVGGAGVVDPGASTINAKKRRRRATLEVPELEIQERPPSTLRNINGGPPVRYQRDQGAPTINADKHRQRAPGRC